MKSINMLNAYRRIKITRTVETFEGFTGEESQRIPTNPMPRFFSKLSDEKKSILL